MAGLCAILRILDHILGRKQGRGEGVSTAGTSPSLLWKMISRREVAEKTFAFHFEKPSGWAFKAGQSVDMTLIDPPETDAEGNTRAFTIASSPQEEHLMVATRMRNTACKRVLGTIPLGTAVKIDGPLRNLTFHNKAPRAAALPGRGICITPVRRIVFHAPREKLPPPSFLFFSNLH